MISVAPRRPVTGQRTYASWLMERWPALFAAVLGLASFGAPAAQSHRPSNAEIFFRLENPCPVTGETRGACAGYVIDRVIPIVCGGAEEPGNMRWLTAAEAQEKARWDRIGCRRGRKLVLPGQERSVTEAFPVGTLPEPVEAQPLPAQAGGQE